MCWKVPSRRVRMRGSQSMPRNENGAFGVSKIYPIELTFRDVGSRI